MDRRFLIKICLFIVQNRLSGRHVMRFYSLWGWVDRRKPTNIDGGVAVGRGFQPRVDKTGGKTRGETICREVEGYLRNPHIRPSPHTHSTQSLSTPLATTLQPNLQNHQHPHQTVIELQLQLTTDRTQQPITVLTRKQHRQQRPHEQSRSATTQPTSKQPHSSPEQPPHHDHIHLGSHGCNPTYLSQNW